ncbi:MAG TPA: FecR domain-containing protein [Chryseosolibacter sp.]
MTRQRLTFLFNRYIDRSISEREEIEFFEAIARAEHDPALNDLLDELWTKIPGDADPRQTAHIFNAMQLERPDKLQQSTRGWWLRVAAAVSVLAIVTSVFYYTLDSSKIPEIASHGKSPSVRSGNFIQLADGSTVLLNAGSVLDYPASFDGKSSRVVSLKGEAFFDIAHDPDHPFVVHSGNVVTTVLGTAFNIKASPNANEVTVTVSRGKVEVKSHQKLIGVLTRDQQVTVKHGMARKTQRVDATQVSRWRETDIAFDDITLKAALDELELRFNTTIKLMDERAVECRFTGSFLQGETLDQILLVICEFNNVSLHHNSETGVYEIAGAGCK